MSDHENQDPFTRQLTEGRKASERALIGKTVDGKYRVIERLGEGGMGAVYRAEHLMMNRVIALKVLHPHLAEREDSLKRFLHEGRVASKLNHPNAVTLFDFGVDDSMPYIAMEFVEGKTLKDTIKKEGALELDRCYRIVEQICGALAEAHELGIVHRDLKPDNIMVDVRRDGKDWVNVLDFGIAKVVQPQSKEEATVMTQTGEFFGTPQYMSPEAMGHELDARSDIYSLGVILYEMLSGDVPFKATSMMMVLMLHMKEKPIPVRKFRPELSVPKAVDAVIMKALEKDPDDRYQTVAQLSEELRIAVGAEPPLGSGTYKGELSNTPVKKAPSIRALGVLAALFVLVIFGGVFASGIFTEKQDSSPILGALKITSDPAGAIVFLNGDKKGSTPLLLKSVPSGTYTIRLTKKGYGDVPLRHRVRPGVANDVNAKLLPLESDETDVEINVQAR